jgi:hypothetical protein
MDLQVGGTSRFRVSKTGVVTSSLSTGNDSFNSATDTSVGTYGLKTRSDGQISWSSTNGFSGTADLILARDAANTLAQRNGTNAQAFRVYNTFTDASNYERINILWSANTAFVETLAAGTGAARSLIIGSNGSGTNLGFMSAGTVRWRVNSNGHLTAEADNTYDIGASGANRPRNVYVGTNIISPQFSTNSFGFSTTTGGYINFASRAGFESPADGVLKLRNNGDTDFSRLQFGGTTSSFPSLKRSSATLEARLADDSNYCNFTANTITGSSQVVSASSLVAHSGTAIPAGGTTGAGVRVSSTANFGVFFGSGAPTLSAAKGSLYLRSDGTTTNDRAYINTDGATTWTALTTAA